MITYIVYNWSKCSYACESMSKPLTATKEPLSPCVIYAVFYSCLEKQIIVERSKCLKWCNKIILCLIRGQIYLSLQRLKFFLSSVEISILKSIFSIIMELLWHSLIFKWCLNKETLWYRITTMSEITLWF